MAKKKTTRSSKGGATKKKAAARSAPKKKTTKKSARKVTKKTATRKKTTKKATKKKKVTKKTTKTSSKKKKTTKKTTAAGASAPVKKASSGKLKQTSNHKGRKKITSAAVLKGYNKVAIGENESSAPLSDAQLRRVKTDLTRSDLNSYRRLLLQKRAEILGDVQALQLDAKNESGNGISYEHMADAGSDNFEQEFTLGLMESERKLLELINSALLRIKKGTYGVCVERGIAINRERLDAKPWARWSIEVAREKEKLGQI